MNHYKHIELFQTKDSLAEILSVFSSTKYFGILESTLYHFERGRYSILYALPTIVIRGHQTDAEILYFDLNNEIIKKERIQKNPLELIKEYYQKYNVIKHDKLPIVGGAIGYMSNDLYMDSTTKKGLPTLAFGFYDTMILEDK
jgi:anthranilate/para-aminobenzoate synthase component I